MKHLFHPSLYQFDQPQPSYREASAGEVSLVNKSLADKRFMLGGHANHLSDPEGADQTFAGLK